MGEVFKPDDLARRVAALEARLDTALAALWRRERIEVDLTNYAIGSAYPTFTDDGHPFSLTGMEPGPAGYLIIGIGCYAAAISGGGIMSVSLTVGPTAVATDVNRAISIDGQTTGYTAASIAGFFATPHLEAGLYSINWESCKNSAGDTVDVFHRWIQAIAV